MTKKFRKTAAFVTSLTVLCCSAQLSAFAEEAMVHPDETQTTASAFPEDYIQSQEKTTDYEVIRSMITEFSTEQNYDKLLGVTVFWKETANFEPDGNLKVTYDYVPLDNLDLDEDATERIKEYLVLNNVDISLIDFIPALKPPIAVEGMINDADSIKSMVKDFIEKQGYRNIVVDVYDYEYGSSYIPIVNIAFPQKAIEESDYTVGDFIPLNDFMKENNINTEFVEIIVLADTAEEIATSTTTSNDMSMLTTETTTTTAIGEEIVLPTLTESTTSAFFPSGLETEITSVTTTVTSPIEDVDLSEICDTLREFATDKNAVYVSKNDGIVVFGSEKQEEIDKAKAYCQDNKIDSKYVFFILIEEEMPVESIVTTTAGYIPDGLETETTTVTTMVTVPVVDVDLNEICNNLREFATDKNAVYVSKKDGIVVFGSEKQEEIDKAKTYCDDNKIDSKYVYFILIQPETDYVSDHTLIVSLFSDYFKANNLEISVFDDANESGKVIVDYDYTNPEYNSLISSFITENNIDSNEVEILVRVDATEELPQTGMPYTRAIEGIAALLTLGGGALIIKSRKENDET